MNEFKSPYKQLDRKVNTWCKYTKRLDTYGRGCQHECKYCYARALLNFRGLWNEPAIANIKTIEQKINKIERGTVLKLGFMTDCFQPLESNHLLTYNTIRLLNKYRLNYLIVTKSDMVINERYLNIYDKNLAHFQITITSTSDNNYENAPPVINRIKTIEKLFDLGFDVSVRLSPFLYERIDYKILNNIQCNKILIEFLKANHWVKKNFNIDYTDYSLLYGGYYNLQLEQKVNLVNKIQGFEQVSVGEYVHDHYVYFRENVNFNKADCCNLTIKEDLKELQLELF